MTDEMIGNEFHSDFEGVCPCGRKFYVDTKRFAVIHETPTCERFQTLEPDKFLRYVRQAITGVTDN
jgi:hypothetical protein